MLKPKCLLVAAVESNHDRISKWVGGVIATSRVMRVDERLTQMLIPRM